MLPTSEREWVLLFVDDGHPTWNPGNDFVQRIPVENRDSMMQRTVEICRSFEFGDFNDSSKIEMNQRWLNPQELFINMLAWSTIEWNTPHLLTSIECVLQANNIPSDSLSCLHEEDRSHLTRRLAEIAKNSIIDGNDANSGLRVGLIEWLQDWSGSESDELVELVRETRLLCGAAPYAEEDVDWVAEGF